MSLSQSMTEVIKMGKERKQRKGKNKQQLNGMKETEQQVKRSYMERNNSK
jgi:hypothetical protein